MTRNFRLFFAAFLCLVVVSCGHLPAGGPSSDDLISEVKQKQGRDDFAVYEVSKALLPMVAAWPETGKTERLSWIGKTQGASTLTIQPDDTLSLQIWDNTGNSLLMTPSQRVVSLDKVLVSADGTVFLPYIGEVRVAGLSPESARKKLQSALEAIETTAQVQLSLNEGRSNSVELVGGVAAPGTYPMQGRNYTVRSLLATGRGVSPSFKNPQIRLVRGNKIFGTSVEKLLDNPNYDTRLVGGDQVFVEEDNRYFLSLGATGTEALHPFTRNQMSAMDALAVIGGVKDGSADPKGLLILREYPDSAIKPGGPDKARVVFSVDLTSLDGLFSARQFQINPNDLVMATESPVNDVVTIAGLIARFLGLANTARRL
jgi:polysaccharide export outer membrane protein